MSSHEIPTFTVKTAVIGACAYVVLMVIIATPFFL